MKCPVCGEDCIREAQEIFDLLPSVFTRCHECRFRILDKRLPLPGREFGRPCHCGRRFIDEVFAHLYVILVEEGIFSGNEPLREVGSPLIHPGFFMRTPPFLTPGSLVLLSSRTDESVARRMTDEVPEIRGVVKTGNFVPGLVDTDLSHPPRMHTLLAGCDLRASVYPTTAGPIVLYQQQSQIHIEFPRAFNPKIESVETRVAAMRPEVFVDACAGVGTLGLTAARMGVPRVILNDAYYAAAFWAAINLHVNSKLFRLEEVRIIVDYDTIAAVPVRMQQVKIAETRGDQDISVYHGDHHHLADMLAGKRVLAVLDLFEKSDKAASDGILSNWRSKVSGEAFIP
ncbi:MAG: hypothetical protein LUQ01_01975 [Methanolinea sp.]|nr:hypothetical protein [Methanolinea sp.]